MVVFCNQNGIHMASVTIKKLPETVYKKLKARAKINNRSINGEIVNLLKKELEGGPVDVNEIIEHARLTRSWAKGKLTDEEINSAKIEGRS